MTSVLNALPFLCKALQTPPLICPRFHVENTASFCLDIRCYLCWKDSLDLPKCPYITNGLLWQVHFSKEHFQRNNSRCPFKGGVRSSKGPHVTGTSLYQRSIAWLNFLCRVDFLYNEFFILIRVSLFKQIEDKIPTLHRKQQDVDVWCMSKWRMHLFHIKAGTCVVVNVITWARRMLPLRSKRSLYFATITIDWCFLFHKLQLNCCVPLQC